MELKIDPPLKSQKSGIAGIELPFMIEERFKVIELIDKGGFGSIFLGIDILNSQAEIIIKIVSNANLVNRTKVPK